MSDKEKGKIKLHKNQKFFESLFDEYYLELVYFSQGILYSSDEAKDIVQEVFCSLWDNCNSISINTSVRAYLFTAVKNRSYNRIRHIGIQDEHQHQIKEAYLFALDISPNENQERLDKIASIVETFPPQMKKSFKLKVEEEKSYKEISEEMQISVNTVKTHLKRAFSLLRTNLNPVLLFIILRFL